MIRYALLSLCVFAARVHGLQTRAAPGAQASSDPESVGGRHRLETGATVADAASKHAEAPEHIRDLIDKLSSNDYAEREAADAALRKTGLPAVAHVAQRYEETDDFETQLRIQRIAEQIYFWDRVLGRNGFLGIQHRRYDPGRNSDRRIEPGTAAFVVGRVIEDTSAERAGLQDGDLIVSIDGLKLPAAADATAFADRIRHKPPGTVIKLEFYRGMQFHTVEVAIGHRPRKYYGGSANADLNAQYAEAVSGFPSWWASHFGTPPVAQPQEYLPLNHGITIEPAIDDDR